MNFSVSFSGLFHSAAIERIGWVLVHSLWQFAAIALFAMALSAFLRQASAERRYQIYLALFAMMVAAPVGTWFLVRGAAERAIASADDRRTAATPTALTASAPEKTRPYVLDPAESREAALNADAAPPASAAAATTEARGSDWAKLASGARSILEAWLGVLVVAWCAGVAAFALRPLLGWIAVRRLLRVGVSSPGQPMERSVKRIAEKLKITRAVRLLESTLVKTPLVVGYFRPAILLPVSIAANMPPAQLESILVHELAHIRRHDFLVNLLQTLCETLFFYHPAIWWLSSRIRIEREHCCDDAAVALVGDKLAYGRALLSLEELRGSASALALGARDGSLASRVRRMLYGEPARPFLGEQVQWISCALAASFLIAVIYLAAGRSTLAAPAVQDAAVYQKGGEAVNGLELRVISVSPKTNENKPSMEAAAVTRFAAPGEIMLAAELKNVSDKPIKLVGVRYGEGVSAPSIGKSNTRRFGPLLFQYAFKTKDGKAIEPPSITGQGNPFLELSGAMIESLEPGKSIVCALRPLETRYEAQHWLPEGEYTLEASYVGVNESTQAEMTKHWPKMGFSGLWNGKVSSNVIPISIEKQTAPELAWGPLTNGLQAAIELRDGDTYRAEGAPAPPPHEFPLGAAVASYVHVKNASDKTITFWSEEFRQGDEIALTNPDGKVTHPPVPFFSGWPIMQKFTLKPGEVAVVYSNIGSGMMASTKTRGRGGPTLSPEAISKAGKYKVQIELNFGNLQTKDAKGNPIPGPDDYSGKLPTGETPFTVRERTPFDDPPKFTAKVVLKSKSGEPIRGGHVAVSEVGGEELLNADISGDQFELKGVDGTKPCYASVRAVGFEEQTFYDLELSEKTPVQLELTKAEPATLRLLSSGKPVSGAKVRYFVRSKALASAGPYPMKGIDGEVWATSNESGEVVLDSLQKLDPLDAKLGENIYWFWIEPPTKLAGRFIGPIRAGQKLGDVTLSTLLTVKGEVRGTPAELDQFSAEWDQPEAMVRGDGSKGWDYAVSQNLTVHRDGDKMTFELTSLRPGRLRFVSNFQGQSSGHEYSKRIVGPTDVALEVELTESRSDIVITSKKTEPPK